MMGVHVNIIHVYMCEFFKNLANVHAFERMRLGIGAFHLQSTCTNNLSHRYFPPSSLQEDPYIFTDFNSETDMTTTDEIDMTTTEAMSSSSSPTPQPRAQMSSTDYIIIGVVSVAATAIILALIVALFKTKFKTCCKSSEILSHSESGGDINMGYIPSDPGKE